MEIFHINSIDGLKDLIIALEPFCGNVLKFNDIDRQVDNVILDIKYICDRMGHCSTNTKIFFDDILVCENVRKASINNNEVIFVDGKGSSINISFIPYEPEYEKIELTKMDIKLENLEEIFSRLNTKNKIINVSNSVLDNSGPDDLLDIYYEGMPYVFNVMAFITNIVFNAGDFIVYYTVPDNGYQSSIYINTKEMYISENDYRFIITDQRGFKSLIVIC